MGVYIKDMEMPKNCRACRLKMNCEDCEGFECVCLPLHTQIGYLDDLLTDKRRDDCPLFPVPPHGRLIDADALEQEAQERLLECDKYDNQFQKPYEIMRAIRVAPVIIPADMEWKMKNCCCCDDKTIIQAEEGE